MPSLKVYLSCTFFSKQLLKLLYIFVSDSRPRISFPSDDIYINMTFELTVKNSSLAAAMPRILESLAATLPPALAADMNISAHRFLNLSLRYNSEANKPSKSVSAIIEEVVAAAQLLVDSGMWDESDQLTQQVRRHRKQEDRERRRGIILQYNVWRLPPDTALYSIHVSTL